MDITKLLCIKNKKIAKTGDDYAIFMPRIYIKNELINPKLRYNVYLEKIEEK